MLKKLGYNRFRPKCQLTPLGRRGGGALEGLGLCN